VAIRDGVPVEMDSENQDDEHRSGRMNTDKSEKIILFPIGVYPLPSVFIIKSLGIPAETRHPI
jgi:hypothetical protein